MNIYQQQKKYKHQLDKNMQKKNRTKNAISISKELTKKTI